MEESVQEIANETEIPPPQIHKPEKNDNRSQFITKLLELDLATHIFVLIALVLIVGVYIIAPNLANFLITKSPDSIDVPPPLVTEMPKQNNNDQSLNLVRPVFANEATVDPNQVFSYPASKVSLAFTGEPKKEVYGFLPYWMLPVYSKINITTLTTAALFGLDVDGKGNIQTKDQNGDTNRGWQMWNSSDLSSFIALAKRKRLHLDLVIKSFNNANTESLVLSDEAQKTFIANVIYLVSSKGFDGVNLDFEYIGTPTKQVREGFTRLIKNLRFEMKRQYPNLTLSIDTYVSEASIPRLVDLQALEDSVDSFVIMAYDFHTPSGQPGPIAPMEGAGYSLIGFLQSYLEKVNPEKIILAIAYYGYDWPIPPTRQGSRVFPYAQIASFSSKHPIQWDDAAQSPYISYTESGQKRVLYFENPRSLAIKYDYVNRKNLRGVGIWALGYDGLNSDLRTLIVEKFSRILTTENDTK